MNIAESVAGYVPADPPMSLAATMTVWSTFQFDGLKYRTWGEAASEAPPLSVTFTGNSGVEARWIDSGIPACPTVTVAAPADGFVTTTSAVPSKIDSLAVPWPIVAFDGLERIRENALLGPPTRDTVTGTATALLVCPGANVNVPLVAE